MLGFDHDVVYADIMAKARMARHEPPANARPKAIPTMNIQGCCICNTTAQQLQLRHITALKVFAGSSPWYWESGSVVGQGRTTILGACLQHKQPGLQKRNLEHVQALAADIALS